MQTDSLGCHALTVAAVRRVLAAVLAVPLSFSIPVSLCAEPFPDHLRGDVGAAVYASTNPVRGDGNTFLPVPFLYCDYERFFARFDTVGVKTLPLAYGHLELLGRINLDGYRTDKPVLRGVHRRRSSLPLGLGTFQETPVGGFFLNAFYDVRQSHGKLYELIYAAQFGVGQSEVYPMLGVEHFSAEYTRHFYGVSAEEAQASRYAAYRPGATSTPMLGLIWDVPVQGPWHANLYLQRRWLGPAISQSPLVYTGLQDEAFVSMSYRYD